MEPAVLIPFPRPSGKPPRRPRQTGPKYFTAQQIKLVRRTCRDAAVLAEQKGQVTAVRSWMLVDLLTSTGLQEAEAAALRCGDLRVGYGNAAVYVHDGKDGRARTVQIPDALQDTPTIISAVEDSAGRADRQQTECPHLFAVCTGGEFLRKNPFHHEARERARRN